MIEFKWDNLFQINTIIVLVQKNIKIKNGTIANTHIQDDAY